MTSLRNGARGCKLATEGHSGLRRHVGWVGWGLKEDGAGSKCMLYFLFKTCLPVLIVNKFIVDCYPGRNCVILS